MQKQSARIWYKGKDHKDIYYQGNYHCAAYIGNELVWEKYLDGKWVYVVQRGTRFWRMETLDPIKKQIKAQSEVQAPNMNHSSGGYIVYANFALSTYNEALFVSNTGGNRLNRLSDLITRDFDFSAALDDRILVCENDLLYELQYSKEDKTYELLEVGELQSGFYPYILGRCGLFLVGYSNYGGGYRWMAFGKDNVFKEFAVLQNATSFCCCQDDDKVYLLAYIHLNFSPYLSYPNLYIYDGNTTEILHPDFGGRFTTNAAMIKRNGKFVIFESHTDGGSNKYVDIYVTEDFSSFETIQFEKCIVPFDDGFEVSAYLQGNRTYHNVAFVADERRVTVDDDTYKVQLPISSIRQQIPVYYESGEIDHDREDMVLPFFISEFGSTAFLVAYLDNLYFEESEGNFGR